MALVTKTIKIDLWQKMRERITVVQREILGRSLTFQLYSGALPVNLTGCTVTFYAEKPDGSIVFNACSIVTAASGICSYTFTEQTIVAAGDLTCQLVIIDSTSNELRTQEFTIEVQASSDYTTSVESASEYTTLQGMIGDINTHETRLDTAESDIDTAEGNITDLQARVLGLVFDVKAYGATGDGTTDDTDAINAAIAAATAVPGSTLYFPAATAYNVDASIAIPSNLNVIMEAPIEYTGSSDIATLVIGDQATLCERKTLKLNVIRSTVSDWSSEDCIAIKIINPDSCDIQIVYAYGHTIGVQMIGAGAGCVTNQVKLLRIRNCKICVDLTNLYYTKKGWANDNQFYGGYLTHVGGYNSTLSRYGIRISSLETDPAKITENNNNCFYKPCIELGTVASPAESVPILLEHAAFNSFYDIHNESNGTPMVRVTGSSTENYLTTRYGTATIEDLSSAPVTYLGAVQTRWYEAYNKLVYDSGNLARKACYYSDSTERRVSAAGIGGINVTASGGLNAYTRYAELYRDFIQAASGYGFGIYVKTDVCKDLLIDVDAEVGYGGRVLIKAYDSSGNILTSAGVNHPYVLGTSTLTLTYNSGYGGVYGTGVDHVGPCFVHLHADVDYILVCLTSGTANLRLRSLKIFSKQKGATSWMWGALNALDCVATLLPVFGTYELGQRIKQATPTVGQPKAWICSVAGTMGTLNAGGTTGGITSGTAALTVNAATDLRVGQYITIVGVTGIKKIINIAALVITLDSNADATVTDAAVAFSAGTFVSEGNL